MQTARYGWSRNVLGLQVESRLHERLGRADQTTNFAATLPPPQSDLAREVVKDPYNFESSRSRRTRTSGRSRPGSSAPCASSYSS